jgi:hypothetical protein
MLPYVKSELSAINFYLELKDFHSIPKTINNIKSFAKRFLKGKNTPGATLRRLLHTSSDAYLQEQFGILPVLSDIVGYGKAITQTKARINALVAGQGKPQKRHYRRILTESTDPETKTFRSPTGNPYSYGCSRPCGAVSKATRYVYTDTSVFHAEIAYNYNFTQYQVEHAQLLGLLDAFGINLNPAIIWNAIPWTFVIDWVLNISSWLNDRRYLNMEPVVNIHNYLWSWTGKRRILVTREVFYDTIYHDISENEQASTPAVPLPVTTEHAYKRGVEMPSAGSIVSSGLSLKEFSLGAALVIVRGSHHKRGGSFATRT